MINQNLSKKLSVAALGAAVVTLGTVGSAEASSFVRGSITNPTPQTTTVDYWNFTVNTAGTVAIDVLARSFNFGNGASALDSQIYLFNNDGSLDSSDFITSNDDYYSSSGYSDGSTSGLDSYLSRFLNPGNYTLAISDFYFSLSEAIAGIQTDSNFIYGPGDYQISFTGDVRIASVPDPGTVLGLMGLSAFGAGSMLKRKHQHKA